MRKILFTLFILFTAAAAYAAPTQQFTLSDPMASMNGNFYINNEVYPLSLKGITLYHNTLESDSPSLHQELSPFLDDINEKVTSRQLTSGAIILGSLAALAVGAYSYTTLMTGDVDSNSFAAKSLLTMGGFTIGSVGLPVGIGMLFLWAPANKSELMNYVTAHNGRSLNDIEFNRRTYRDPFGL